MKGIICAGGNGTRLRPLTKVTNKHLLPVGNVPMIYHPINTLVKAGITDIMIILGGESVGDVVRLLGSGKDFGVTFTYRYQDEAGGIAQAIGLAKQFVNNDKFITILGDNIIEDDITLNIDDFEKKPLCHAGIFLKEVDDPERFGVVRFENNIPVEIIEKPKNSPSNYAVTGLYMYDNTVFDIIENLKPSTRGELEITDVNNFYLQRSKLDLYTLKGYWLDGGTFSSLVEANKIISKAKIEYGEI